MQQVILLGCALCVPGDILVVVMCAPEWRCLWSGDLQLGLGSADATPVSSWGVPRELRGPACSCSSVPSVLGLPQLHTHVCEVRKMVWKFLSFRKFTFPVSFQASVTSSSWSHHQAKRDSQTSLLSSAQIQRKIKANSGKCSTWCGRRRGRLVGGRVSNALSGRGLGQSLWTGTANSSCSSWPGCCFSQLCLDSGLSELRGWTSVWARWEVLSVFLSCSCLWGIGKNESDTVL